ncbi:MAG: hypothetical protein U0Q11_24060 [Vicinamibacterales bacterium]
MRTFTSQVSDQATSTLAKTTSVRRVRVIPITSAEASVAAQEAVFSFIERLALKCLTSARSG